MPEDYFGEEVAAHYDASEEQDPMFSPEAINPVVDFLVELAGDGLALELGIGTGRIALPLAERGVPVHGIDLSEAMVARLRAKPGADKIDVTMGDFAVTKVDGTFTVAYVVYNTIQNLTTQDAQVACFQNVAAHLEPGGCFVIEVGLPDLQRLPFGETIRPFHLSDSRLGFDTVRRRESGPRLAPLHARRRREIQVFVGAFPLRLAVGAGPDGADRGHDAARALERLET